LVITDASGCSYTAPTIVLSSTAGPTAISVSTINPACGQSNGTINLGAVTGGTSPFTYNFNNLGYTTAVSFNNLAAGNYTLDVQDANGCIYSAPAIVLNSSNGPTAITVNTVDPSCGQSDGTISLGTVTGGTGPYTYNFNNSGFSGTTVYPNLAAGSFSLDVQDANGCLFSAPSIALTNLNGPTSIQISTTNESCGLVNGSITLGTVNGGTPPYTYNFNNQGYSSLTNFSNLQAGNYSVVVQDAVGCIYTAPITAIAGTNGPTAILVNSSNPTCGQTNGTISLGQVTGGTAPYSFDFNNQGPGTTTSFSNLSSGNYSLVVADANGCTYNAPAINLNSSNGPTAIVVSTTDPTCNQSNGTILLGAVSGGTAPYTYNLNGQGFSGNTNYTNLSSGTYTLQISDASGCTFNTPNVVLSSANGPLGVAVTVTSTSCGETNGAIDLGLVSGGQSPYSYSIDNQPFSSFTSFTALGSGTHTLSIRDANGCQYDTTISILPSTGISNATINIQPSICIQSNGTISIDSVFGGAAPYQYQLNSLGFVSSADFQNLNTGLYTITIQDNNGCQWSIQKLVFQDFSSGPQKVNYVINPPDCEGINGSLALENIVGGTAPYSLSINGLTTNPDTLFSNLDTGRYSILVIDANGCELIDSIQIKQKGLGDVFIPNSFTPNKDNKNELWTIKGYCIKHFECIIFNRWGEFIGRIDDLYNPAWDGLYKGLQVQQGVYIYSAFVTFESNDTKTYLGQLNITY